jgi:hypothetical protein
MMKNKKYFLNPLTISYDNTAAGVPRWFNGSKTFTNPFFRGGGRPENGVGGGAGICVRDQSIV